MSSIDDVLDGAVPSFHKNENLEKKIILEKEDIMTLPALQAYNEILTDEWFETFMDIETNYRLYYGSLASSIATFVGMLYDRDFFPIFAVSVALTIASQHHIKNKQKKMIEKDNAINYSDFLFRIYFKDIKLGDRILAQEHSHFSFDYAASDESRKVICKLELGDKISYDDLTTIPKYAPLTVDSDMGYAVFDGVLELHSSLISKTPRKFTESYLKHKDIRRLIPVLK